ncbi:MAG: NAD-dependent epimerase/dehydratase family protein, partial [Deltaproteobacteria bacterium]|nr:NAD-dependent epimerase/dehydratase family protein [Deltaproteobacteria bacterium]
LHQAALGSVPRSIAAPLASHASNVDGFLNLLWSAKEAGVRRIVYASSSSVYGDSQVLPKTEGELGQPLSPYAVTKLVDELYAGVFGKLYQMELVGLRYFNVFGPRQNPAGPYAAVIPRWIDALMQGRSCVIFGDGETSRDFCYVANVVQANLLAADTTEVPALNRVYNVSCGEQTTLNRLFEIIRDGLASLAACKADVEVEHADFRAGDVRHSLADISAIRKYLGYEPQYMLPGGISKTLDWYFSTSKS